MLPVRHALTRVMPGYTRARTAQARRSFLRPWPGYQRSVETWDALRARRNVRVFSSRPLSADHVDQILEAGRLRRACLLVGGRLVGGTVRRAATYQTSRWTMSSNGCRSGRTMGVSGPSAGYPSAIRYGQNLSSGNPSTLRARS